MLVKFTSGPRAGESVHLPPLEARTLISGGFAEEVVTAKPGENNLEKIRRHQRESNPPAKPDAVEWFVDFTGNIQRFIAIVMKIGATTVTYGGDPARVNAVRRWDGGQQWLSGFGRECPEAVVREYAARFKAAKPNERFVPIDTAKDELGSNKAMAGKVMAKQAEQKKNEAALADFVRPQQGRIPVVLGTNDGEVEYELGDPAIVPKD